MPEPLEAWSRLEAAHPGGNGVFRLRILAETALDLFAIVELPESKVGLQMEVASSSASMIRDWASGSGFRTSVRKSGGRSTITTLLEIPGFRGVFGEMSVDVLKWCVLAGRDEGLAVRRLAERLRTWKELFSGGIPRPLSDDEQVGLFGELSFLAKLLDRSVSPSRAVPGWRGPLGDPHDFHLGQVHIEVKATLCGGEGVVRVNGLQQLDPSGTRSLYLWHCRIQTDQEGGQTLRNLVEVLRSRLLAEDAELRVQFDDRLLKAGYMEVHAPDHYDERRLAVVRERPLRVDDGFPSLTRRTVPVQILDARYGLAVDQVPERFDVEIEAAWSDIRTEDTGEASGERGTTAHGTGSPGSGAS